MRYIPYIMTAFSVAGTIANSFQKKWCFWLWICTNIFWCGYNVLNNQYAQALLYVFNFAMCIVGLLKWQKPQSNDRIRHCDDCRYKIVSAIPELPLPEPQTEEPQAERQEVPKAPEEPFTRMSNAVSEFTSALIDAIQPTIKAFQEAINNFAKNYCGGDYEFLIWLNEHADPKTLNRAYNAPKYRTRKKNFSRLKREYKKYIKKRSGGV